MSPEPQTADGRWRSTRHRLIHEGLALERAEALATALLDADARQGAPDELRDRIDRLTDMVLRLAAEVEHLHVTAGHTDRHEGGFRHPITLITAASFPGGKGQTAEAIAFRLGVRGCVALPPASTTTTGGTVDGATLFTQNCASCHTLAAAGATGTVAGARRAAGDQRRRWHAVLRRTAERLPDRRDRGLHPRLGRHQVSMSGGVGLTGEKATKRP